MVDWNQTSRWKSIIFLITLARYAVSSVSNEAMSPPPLLKKQTTAGGSLLANPNLVKSQTTHGMPSCPPQSHTHNLL